MFRICVILGLCSCLTVQAADWTVKNGTVFRNVSVISADPDSVLIVHDDGGCQVKYSDLMPGSLTESQRAQIEQDLKVYAERQAAIARAEAERKAFETAQRSKGLVEFEGAWMKPLEKEELLLKREERWLAIERGRLQLAREKAALQKEQLANERARYLLEGDPRTTTLSVTYSSVFDRSGGYLRPHYYHNYRTCADEYRPSLLTRNNFKTTGKRGGRIYIETGRPVSFSSGSSDF